MGLAWRVCEPERLLTEAHRHAEIVAAQPIPNLIAVRKAMIAPMVAEIKDAVKREMALFDTLMGAEANIAALTAFNDRAR